MKAGESGEDGFAGGQIEACGGFIQKEKFRLADEGTRQQRAETLPCGERVIKLIRLRRQPNLSQQMKGMGDLYFRWMGIMQRERGKIARGDHLAGGDGLVEGVNRGGFDDADAGSEARPRGTVPSMYRRAVGLTDPFLRPEISAGQPQQRGLAAAIGAQDGGDLSWFNGPVNIGKDRARVALRIEAEKVEMSRRRGATKSWRTY